MRSMDEWLQCEETGKAFTHCVRCRLPLLEVAEPWLVNKSFHRRECVLEYAICKPCRDQTTGELSEDSRETVRHFLETEIDWHTRQQEFMMMQNEADRVKACIACRTAREDCEGFAISAIHDSEGHLITGPLPLLICHDCVAKITVLLSPESKAVWRKFIAEHFAGPPEADVSDGGFGIF